MKRILLAALLSMQLAIVANAGASSGPTGRSHVGRASQQSVADPVNESAKYALKLIIDFWNVDSLSEYHTDHVFSIHNGGKASITLDHLEPSCGCTSSYVLDSAVPASNIVLPGHDALVYVSVSPSQLLPGPFSKSVLIYIRGRKEAYAELRMTGRLLPVATFSDKLLDFGTCRVGTRRSLSLEVTFDVQQLPKGLAMHLVSTDPDVIVDANPVLDPASMTQSYTIALSSQAHPGSHYGKGAVVLSKTNAKVTADGLSAGSISVVGSVTGDISSSPAVISFGKLIAGTSGVQQVFITGSMDAPSALRVTVSNPNLSFDWIAPKRLTISTSAASNSNKSSLPSIVGDNATTLLRVTLSARAAPGPYTDSITITTSQNQRLVLPVYALVVPAVGK